MLCPVVDMILCSPVGVLAPLARVGLAPQPVHGDGQGLVRLQGDAPEGHGAYGGEHYNITQKCHEN